MQRNREVLTEAEGRWRDILLSLGVDPKFLQNRHGPCPMCAGTDRYRFDDKMQRGNWYCNKCGSGDGVALLMAINHWDFKQCVKEVERVIGTARLKPVRDEKTDEQKKKAMHDLLAEAKVVTVGDPVWKYLSNRAPGLSMVPRDIRYHPSLWHTEAKREFPAMLATLRYADGNGASVHRTYLDGMGGKAPIDPNKKMWPGLPINGSCVRLSGIEPLVGIAEGIETALAASIVFGFPVWAATNATVLEKWEPPKGIQEVVICGDNDTSYAGQAAAYNLAKRLKTKGFAVSVEIPDPEDTDWADALKTGNGG